MSEPNASRDPDFEAFLEEHGDRLRRVLVARYGVDVGNDICADALAYAWQHWDRVRELDNAVGYLYRVAQSSLRKHRRWSRTPKLPAEVLPTPESVHPDSLDLGLHTALTKLRPNQRACVVMVHVYDWTYQQTADALNMPVTSVRNHLHRGLAALKKALEA